jgi:hypothetical protein
MGSMSGKTMLLFIAVALTIGLVAGFVFASLRSPEPSTVPSIELEVESTSGTDPESRNNEGGQGGSQGRENGGGEPAGDSGSNDGSGATTDPGGSGGSNSPGVSDGSGGASGAQPAPPPPPALAGDDDPRDTDDGGETGEPDNGEDAEGVIVED